jgi:hypothetical protein
MGHNEASGLVEVHRDYAKVISDYCLSASSRPAGTRLQQVVTIACYRKRVQCPGALESLAFEPLLPLAGLCGPG